MIPAVPGKTRGPWTFTSSQVKNRLENPHPTMILMMVMGVQIRQAVIPGTSPFPILCTPHTPQNPYSSCCANSLVLYNYRATNSGIFSFCCSFDLGLQTDSSSMKKMGEHIMVIAEEFTRCHVMKRSRTVSISSISCSR